MAFKLNLFEYDNYRDYLRDAYKALKAFDKKFSFRYFSRVAGFKSSNVLKQVIDGKRNIAVHSIEKFAKAFKLNKEESFFFYHLVQLNQATTINDRKTHAEFLLKCRLFKKLHPLSEAQFNYLSQWYFVPIRELVSLPGFNEDPEWIAKKINPAISPAEARRAVEELLQLGLLQRGPSGRLEATAANLSTGDEVLAAAAAVYHREMLTKAAESIERFPREVRDISAISFSLSSRNVKVFKEMIQKFRKELLEMASRDPDPDKVYQLNFQLFPVSEQVGEENR